MKGEKISKNIDWNFSFTMRHNCFLENICTDFRNLLLEVLAVWVHTKRQKLSLNIKNIKDS